MSGNRMVETKLPTLPRAGVSVLPILAAVALMSLAPASLSAWAASPQVQAAYPVTVTLIPNPDPVPPICIGASGEKVGLPLAGRLADIWNGSSRGTDADWVRRRDIVRESAESAGRDPDEIVVSTTLERALPENDTDSEVLVDLLGGFIDLGVSHFVMDFGHPKSIEPVLRFAEQVIAPLRSR